MKKTALCLALLGLLALGGQAVAVICTIDEVPAATLLLPYFEVNLSDPNGLTTLFSINNASATAILAHVIVWTDLSVVALDFDVYLTGYDVQTINLRDILVNGVLPRTASAGQDGGDAISPKGSKSQDINFASCTGFLPLPNLPPSFLLGVQQALTGRASVNYPAATPCGGRALGDNIARGYITVDTVNACSLGDPTNSVPVYFGGLVTDQNVLWGDYFYVNTGQNFASGNPLVHIEASATNPATSTAGRYTFYGRYDNPAWNAVDHREPLSTEFAGRYVNGGDFSGGTSYLVWRDSKTKQSPFACNSLPSWYPLGEEGIVIFDEQEHPNTPATNPFSPQVPGQTLLPFPAEAQRTKIGGADFPVPTPFGWIFLDLNTTVAGNPNPPVDPAAAQAWVTIEMDANGRFSVGYDALQLDSACAASHFVP
jgi:hypothetical protein